eukprot:COSAG02_NODE_251_length_27002_cov_13.799242_18_plen_85_part_00
MKLDACIGTTIVEGAAVCSSTQEQGLRMAPSGWFSCLISCGCVQNGAKTCVKKLAPRSGRASFAMARVLCTGCQQMELLEGWGA